MRTGADSETGTLQPGAHYGFHTERHADREVSDDRWNLVELRGFEPLTPSMRTRCATGLRYSPKTASQRSKRWGLFAPW